MLSSTLVSPATRQGGLYEEPLDETNTKPQNAHGKDSVVQADEAVSELTNAQNFHPFFCLTSLDPERNISKPAPQARLESWLYELEEFKVGASAVPWE